MSTWEFSYDDPDGTGDHENYMSKSNEIFALDGTKYSQCEKKALHIRSRNSHEPWYGLTGKYSDLTFLFSNDTNFYRASENLKSFDGDIKRKYTRILSADYG